MRRIAALLAAAVLILAIAPPVAAGKPTKPVTLGPQMSPAGLTALTDYCAQKTGQTVVMSTDGYPDDFEAYLRGTSDEVVDWFAGERMRFFANQGLLTPINDVWWKIRDNYTPALQVAATGDHGRQYIVPLTMYPWVVIYRKSLFAAKGYQIPKTLSQFVALAKKMQHDGLAPLVSADADGWPAEGMFDILDMRMNGYRFHMDLLAGRQKWTDPRVKAVFQEWARLLPYFQPNAASRHWWDGAASLFSEEAGMYFLGTFASWAAPDQTVADDLGMFPFPVFGNQYDSERAIDAPVEGLMLSANHHDLNGAKKLLECAGTGPAQVAYIAADPTMGVAAARNADTSGYTPYQKATAQVIQASNKVAQFLDRDARPDFTGPNGMQAFLASFLANPNQDLHAYLHTIQSFWDSLPPQ
jgi:multiple sugar transport system substrate-binding protein